MSGNNPIIKLGLLVGVVLGALFGFLFAPSKGKDVRKKLKKEMSKGEYGQETFKSEGKKLLDDLRRFAQSIVDSDPVQGNLKKGKDQMQKITDDLKKKGEELSEMTEDIKKKAFLTKGKLQKMTKKELVDMLPGSKSSNMKKNKAQLVKEALKTLGK